MLQSSFAASYGSGIQVVVYLGLLQAGPDTLFALTLSLLLVLGFVVACYRAWRFSRDTRPQHFSTWASCWNSTKAFVCCRGSTLDIEEGEKPETNYGEPPESHTHTQEAGGVVEMEALPADDGALFDTVSCC